VLRVGLIGLGGVAERIHIPAIRAVPSVELVGACEPDDRRRETVARRFALPSVFRDAKSMLEGTHPDLAIVGSPPGSHRDLCLLSLAHGAHVLCEKPFVASVAEADEVIAEADRQHRLVAVNNQYRYMPIYRQTRDRITEGAFGRPFLIQCWQQMFHPPSKESNWRRDLVRSTLFEFGTHALDLVCHFFDALPTAVSALTPHPRPEIAADVVALVTFAFPGERAATMVFNRISHAPNRYFEMRIDCLDASLRISLGGVARFALEWSAALGRPTPRWAFVRGGEARVERNGRSTSLVRDRRPTFASATAAKLGRFVVAIEQGASSNDEARYARELMRIVFAMYDAAESGQTIHLNGRVIA
jgi:predicted dehydrogenase